MRPEREAPVLIAPFDAPLTLGTGLRRARRHGRSAVLSVVAGCPLLLGRGRGRARAGIIPGPAPTFIWSTPRASSPGSQSERIVVGAPVPNDRPRGETSRPPRERPETRQVASPRPESPGWITALEWRHFTIRERTVERRVMHETLVPLLQRALGHARAATPNAMVMMSAVRPAAWAGSPLTRGSSRLPRSPLGGEDRPTGLGVRPATTPVHGDPVLLQSRPRSREGGVARPLGSVSAAPNAAATRAPYLGGEQTTRNTVKRAPTVRGADTEQQHELPVRHPKSPSRIQEAEVQRLVEREVQRRLPPQNDATAPARDVSPVGHAADPISIDQLATRVADRLHRMAREERFRAGLLR